MNVAPRVEVTDFLPPLTLRDTSLAGFFFFFSPRYWWEFYLLRLLFFFGKGFKNISLWVTKNLYSQIP